MPSPFPVLEANLGMLQGAGQDNPSSPPTLSDGAAPASGPVAEHRPPGTA